MKNIHYIFIILTIASLLFVRYDLARRTEPGPQPAAVKAAAVMPAAPAAPAAVPAPVPKGPSFTEKFKQESAAVAELQSDPEAAQERLRQLARGMTQKDVESLYEIISDDRNDGDQRALAVELLSLKNDTASLIALQNFVASEKTATGKAWDRKKELETVLRAQAVESIAAYPQKEIALSTLSFLQRRVNESFLNDRIGRATAHLMGRAPSPEQQDDEALRKLIE